MLVSSELRVVIQRRTSPDLLRYADYLDLLACSAWRASPIEVLRDNCPPAGNSGPKLRLGRPEAGADPCAY